MKKLIYIVLFTFSYYSYSEVNIKVYNNYLIYSYPELSPHSTTIKRQKISSTIPFNLPFTKVAGKNTIIECQKNGFITFINKKNLGLWLIDYEKKLRLINNSFVNSSSGSKSTQISKYDITFNENNDIQKESLSKNDFFDINTNYIYDEKKRLIKFLEKVNAFFVMNKIDYTNQNLAKLIKSENVEDPELFSSDETSNEIIEYIYDDENRIIQTKQSMYLAETKNRINMDCFFTNHNKHGDWTKGYCSANKKNLGDFKREIEYW